MCSGERNPFLEANSIGINKNAPLSELNKRMGSTALLLTDIFFTTS